MNTLARLYAFQKVSSLQEAAGYGAAGAGLGALGAGAHGMATGYFDFIGPAKRHADWLNKELDSAVEQSGQAWDRFMNEARKGVPDPDKVRKADIARKLKEGRAKYLTNELAKERDWLADGAPKAMYKRMKGRAIGGALALGGLGAGVGLMS